MTRKLVLLSALATALLAPLPSVGAEETPSGPPPDCRMVADPMWLERHVGRTVTVTGRFTWDIHYQTLYPQGCGDHPLFATLTNDTVNQLDRYLETTYPGKTFGGGDVWGVFTGKVIRGGSKGIAYVRIDAMTIDDSRRMRFAPAG